MASLARIHCPVSSYTAIPVAEAERISFSKLRAFCNCCVRSATLASRFASVSLNCAVMLLNASARLMTSFGPLTATCKSISPRAILVAVFSKLIKDDAKRFANVEANKAAKPATTKMIIIPQVIFNITLW